MTAMPTFYNYFRDYDPQTGRYIQSDPIGLWGGLNTFAYSGLDPIGTSDPWGLAPGDIFHTREAAESDRAMFAALLRERMFAPDVILSSILGGDEWDGAFLTNVYQVNWVDETSCSARYTYDRIEYAVGYPPGFGRKFGKLGQFKGRDALRRENNVARDAAKAADLNQDQRRQLHDAISGQGLTYQQILQIANDIAGKK